MLSPSLIRNLGVKPNLAYGFRKFNLRLTRTVPVSSSIWRMPQFAFGSTRCASRHDLDVFIHLAIHDLLAHGNRGLIEPGLRVTLVDLTAHEADQFTNRFRHIGAVAHVLLDVGEVQVLHAVAPAP